MGLTNMGLPRCVAEVAVESNPICSRCMLVGKVQSRTGPQVSFYISSPSLLVFPNNIREYAYLFDTT